MNDGVGPPKQTTVSIQAAIDLAQTFYVSDDLVKAEDICSQILKAKPNNPQALNLMGLIRHKQGKADAAISLFLQATIAQPDYTEAYYNLGLAYKDLELVDDAINSFDFANKIDPDNAGTLFQLAGQYFKNMQPNEAMTCYQKVIALEPENELAHSNLGNSLKIMGRLDEAQSCYQKALSIQPDYIDAHINYSDVQIQLGQRDAAIASLERALVLSPLNGVAHWNLSIAVLMAGDYMRGWELNEWRWKSDQTKLIHWRDFPQPQWDGSNLSGKRIFVWAEQGLGDEMYFASLYPQLLAQGATCIFECEPRLVDLLQRSFPKAVVVGRFDPAKTETLDPSIDFQCPAGSLMRLLELSFNGGMSRENFLVPDQSRVNFLKAQYKQDGAKKVVGLGWATPDRHNAMSHIVPIDIFDAILQTPDVRFVNLQYGDRRTEIEAVYNRTGVRIYQDSEINPLMSLDDFAAQEAAMDLIISNVNSTAVMAAGLGVPVWGLVPKVPEWRCGSEGDAGLWFPSMRMFRQSEREGWRTVSESLGNAFSEWMESS